MVHTVEVGDTGRVRTLMTLQLDSINPPSKKGSIQTAPVSVYCGGGGSTTKKLPAVNYKPSSSAYGASRVTGSSHMNPTPRNACVHIPILSAEDISADNTPVRGSSRTVEIVNLKCGKPQGAWPVGITTRIKKLGFSRLSDKSGK